jgi:hypothetical protein
MSETKEDAVRPAKTPQPLAQNRATGTDTVTVACNLPTGLLLQIYNIEIAERTLPNGNVITENHATLNLDHGQWYVHGPVNFNSLAASGREVNADFRVIRGDVPDGGYALTPGIPRDFWEQWERDNARSPLITGKHVFAASSESRAVGQAKEYREFKSGFQGLNQAGDYRVPNGKLIRKFDHNDNVVVNAPEEPE